MGRVGELLQQQAEETAERAERLANDELRRRSGHFAEFLKSALDTTRQISAEAVEAQATHLKQAAAKNQEQLDDALKRVSTQTRQRDQALVEDLSTKLTRQLRPVLQKAMFRAALVGAIAGAMTTAGLLFILTQIIS